MPSRAGDLRISGGTQFLSMRASAVAKTEWRMLPALIPGYRGTSPFLRLRRDSWMMTEMEWSEFSLLKEKFRMWYFLQL